MKYLWIVIVGLWSMASIADIVNAIRYRRDPKSYTCAWIILIIVGLCFWSLALWLA